MTDALRRSIVEFGRALSDGGLAHGTSGNISVRCGEAILMTPTNSRLGRLTESQICHVSMDGTLLSGPKPSKELGLHLNVYRARPVDAAVVHLHAAESVAFSCLADLDPHDALPPLTAYSLMRLGRVALVPFHPPGAPELADEVGEIALNHHAVLLANHGTLVAADTLDNAVAHSEELEQTAKIALALRGRDVKMVPRAAADQLRQQTIQGWPGIPGACPQR